jgi:hypothetical protein
LHLLAGHGALPAEPLLQIKKCPQSPAILNLTNLGDVDENYNFGKPGVVPEELGKTELNGIRQNAQIERFVSI